MYRYSDRNKAILRKWMLDNIEDPYADKKIKIELAELTGLTTQQVGIWMTNARKTKWFRKSNTCQKIK
jgi:hypothetical protein